MVDLVKLTIKAGNGGDGRISFHRSRYNPKGGPNGGDGGRGGSVMLRANGNLHTLRDYAGRIEISAHSGKMGGAELMHGADSPDEIISLPKGTIVWRVMGSHNTIGQKYMYRNDPELGRVERENTRVNNNMIQEKEGLWQMREARDKRLEVWEDAKQISIGSEQYEVEYVGEVTATTPEFLIARGGEGGRGNWQFRSSTNTTPMEAEAGQKGETGTYIFELVLLADIGLIGYPNVGKSTLLSILTKAQPKIANYPFTTLEPNLGVLEVSSPDPNERRSILIADIPGIIEGASEGKGLGLEFLRHISRCKVLVVVLSIDDATLADTETTAAKIVKLYEAQYKSVQAELAQYEAESRTDSEPLREKKMMIVLTKADIVDEERRTKIATSLTKKFGSTRWVSSTNKEGVEELKTELLRMVK